MNTLFLQSRAQEVSAENAAKIRSRRIPMKRFQSLLLLSFPVALTGCEAIADIFKAGVWTGVILVVGVIGVIIWLISRSVS
jgi:hypothetical protein